jgi:hypothetical protein
VHGYLRQQNGYGFAESQLQLRYPGRFNIFGDLVWRGNLYDSVHASLRREGLPSVFRPRVYRGWFGSAPYQSIYQRFHTWWFQVFTAAEWQGTTLCCLLAATLAWWHHSPHAAALLLGLTLLMAALSLGAASLAAAHAVRAEKWTGEHKIKGFLLVGWLHLVQPLYRSVGRVRGWWYTRRNATEFPPIQRVWGNAHQRERWLERLPDHLATCGWICRASSEWDSADLDIEGPGPCRLQLVSTTEEDKANQRYFVRYRVTARMKRRTPLMLLAMVLTLPIWIIFPYLIPFALPVIICFRLILHAEHYMVSAVSQLALECAEALDMPRVVEPGN